MSCPGHRGTRPHEDRILTPPRRSVCHCLMKVTLRWPTLSFLGNNKNQHHCSVLVPRAVQPDEDPGDPCLVRHLPSAHRLQMSELQATGTELWAEARTPGKKGLGASDYLCWRCPGSLEWPPGSPGAQCSFCAGPCRGRMAGGEQRQLWMETPWNREPADRGPRGEGDTSDQ